MPIFQAACCVLAGVLTAGPEPISLIRDASLEGWQGDTGLWFQAGNASLKKDDPTYLESSPGRGVLINGPLGNTVNLLSEMEHADVQLHVEFMVSEGSTSGIYLMSRYEVQILDRHNQELLHFYDTGGIYQRFNEVNQIGSEGKAPLLNASKPPGEWQTFDITFRAPRFDKDGRKTQNARFVKVELNGQVVQENVEVTGHTRAAKYSNEAPLGPLMLQGKLGPVAFRNIEVVHLNMD